MAEALGHQGHTLVEEPAEADVYVLNSCTVTHAADADARRAVRRARRSNPALRVVLTGCHVDADPKAAAALPGVDAVLGNADKGELEGVLRAMGPGGEAPLVSVTALTRRMPFTPLPPAVAPQRSRVLLKVQDGCNYRCAFCIVPKVRGPSRSLAIDEAVAQARRIVSAGAPEVVLTGVHLGTYGRDLRPRRRLSDLVRALVPCLGPSRLRLSSIDPQEVDDELLALMADEPTKVCRHLHLPVQAGDDAVLRRMRRGHTAQTFRATVKRAATLVPGIAIGSDVIAGFPGEDEESFERTVALLRGLPLSYLHVFPYSERQGTAAVDMPGAVPAAERRRRARVLRALSDAMVDARRAEVAGTIVDVVAHRRPGRDGRLEGLTDDFLRVRLPAERGDLAGRRLRARLGHRGVQARPIGASLGDV